MSVQLEIDGAAHLDSDRAGTLGLATVSVSFAKPHSQMRLAGWLEPRHNSIKDEMPKSLSAYQKYLDQIIQIKKEVGKALQVALDVCNLEMEVRRAKAYVAKIPATTTEFDLLDQV